MGIGLIADIIIVAIIALSAFIGYKQGLVKVAIKIASFFIAIIIALILYKPVSNIIINNTQIDDNIQNSIIEKITPEGLTKEDKVTSEVNLTTKIVDTTNNSIENIANQFTVKLIEIVVLLLIYIIAKIILKFITALADLIAKLPILKQFNETGGLIYGLIKGTVIVFIVLGILLLCEPLIGTTVSDILQTSIIAKIIYNNNILINIIL